MQVTEEDVIRVLHSLGRASARQIADELGLPKTASVTRKVASILKKLKRYNRAEVVTPHRGNRIPDIWKLI